MCNCLFSGNDYTHVYGGSKDEGNYTPCIANCFSPHVKSCILDGEMVGFNADTKTIGSDFYGCLFYSLLCLLDCLANVKIREANGLILFCLI